MDGCFPCRAGRASSFLWMRWITALALVLSAGSRSYEDDNSLGREEGTIDSPVHQQYAHHGASKVILSCPIPGNTSSVQWTVNGMSEDVWKVARKDGSLALRNVTWAQEGEYKCRDGATGQTLRRIRLKLGYPPEKPKVQCRSASYPSANCTWSLERETHLPTYFFSTYRYGMEGEVRECIQTTLGANSCYLPNIQMFAIEPYLLNVTAVNPLGTATRLFPIFLNEILQPDPPEGVKVSPIRGERKKLLLEWKPPASWQYPEYFPLKYVIRYSREGSDLSKTTQPTEQTSFVLTGIRSGVRYRVQVAARDFLDNGEYSAWSTMSSGTAWVPSNLPGRP